MPCAFSTSEMSTVTPHTITITRHGIRLIASPSSADRRQDEDHRTEERAHADVDLRENHTQDQRGDDADRDPMTPLERPASVASGLAGPSWTSGPSTGSGPPRLAGRRLTGQARAKQFQAAKERVAAEGDSAWASRLYR